MVEPPGRREAVATTPDFCFREIDLDPSAARNGEEEVMECCTGVLVLLGLHWN